MRLFWGLSILATFCIGGWYAWENVSPLRKFVHEKLNTTGFQTLEIRHLADEIMESNKTSLLKDSNYAFLEPQLYFYPYLLMEIKYSKDRTCTQEGTLLWGLMDGEMVVDTQTWETTHGFEDCLLANADKNDFKVIKSLIKQGGSSGSDFLYSDFNVEQKVLDGWLSSCCSKKLVVACGNHYRLHFEDPRLEIKPITKLNQALVTQPTKHSLKVKNRYSLTQIKKLAQIAFGGDFAIRKTEHVYLPVYKIGVQNPDGSTRTVFFNALNGKPLEHRMFGGPL